MNEALGIGHRFVVGFFFLCSALGVLNVVSGLLARTKWGLFIAVAQGVFSALAAAGAWNIYRWKKVGWAIGMLVVLDSLSGIVNFRLGSNWLTPFLACAMLAVLVWLWLPEVRAKFGVKKVFS